MKTIKTLVAIAGLFGLAMSSAFAADCKTAKAALASAKDPAGYAQVVEAVAGPAEATKFLAVYGKDGDGAKKVAEQVVASCK